MIGRHVYLWVLYMSWWQTGTHSVSANRSEHYWAPSEARPKKSALFSMLCYLSLDNALYSSIWRAWGRCVVSCWKCDPQSKSLSYAYALASVPAGRAIEARNTVPIVNCTQLNPFWLIQLLHEIGHLLYEADQLLYEVTIMGCGRLGYKSRSLVGKYNKPLIFRPYNQL